MTTPKAAENGHAGDEIEVLFTHRKPKRVYIEDSANGARTLCEIREMGEEDYSSWMKENGRRFQVVDGKMVRQKYEGLNASLIARCLFYADGSQSGRRVPRAMIDTWGTALKQHLAAICTEVNKLNQRAVEEEGKG